jgi:hypothetical protein
MAGVERAVSGRMWRATRHMQPAAMPLLWPAGRSDADHGPSWPLSLLGTQASHLILNCHFAAARAVPRQVAWPMEDTVNRPRPLRPDRLRTIERPFGWIPFRLLTCGLLTQLSGIARQLYLVLCIVADRHGLSFYSDWRLSLLLQLSDDQLAQARQELVERDLLAYNGRVYQLLSLPPPSPQKDRDAQHVADILKRLGLGG